MATIDQFGDTSDPLSAPALGGATGWAAAVRDAIVALQSAGGGVVDHGALEGLLDDDHTQYARSFVQASAPANPRVGDFWAVTPAPAFVQEKASWLYDTSSPFEMTVTFGTPVTAGNSIVLNVAHNGEDVAPTITDSAGNSYQLINRIGSGDGSGAAYCSQFFCVNPGAVTWVKSELTTSGKVNIVQAIEFSGIGSSRASNKAVSSATNLAATNTAGDLIVCMSAGLVAAPPATTGGTGYTALDDQYHAGTNAQSLCGAWRVSSTDNVAGATFTGFGTHGLITSSFAPG